jgi:hypothetical protein
MRRAVLLFFGTDTISAASNFIMIDQSKMSVRSANMPLIKAMVLGNGMIKSSRAYKNSLQKEEDDKFKKPDGSDIKTTEDIVK